MATQVRTTKKPNKPLPLIRTIGIDLSGAKNNKTAITVLEHYPKEGKTFLLEIYDRITPRELQSGDQALIEVLSELIEHTTDHSIIRFGTSCPLTLPPFFQSKKKVGLTEDTQDEAISWMREITKKAIRKGVLDSNKDHGFTPYTQRPIELWVKYEFLPRLERDNHFEIDEAFGGNKAPLTARMQYLSRYFSSQNFVECWPKLTLAVLTEKFSIKSDWVKRYRKIQDGVEARAEILEHLIEEQNLFIYENDLNRLTHNLGCFDSFLCALSALLFEKGKTFRRPESFPFENEWLAIPTL